MPLPRHANLSTLLPFLLAGQAPPMGTPPFAGSRGQSPDSLPGVPTGGTSPQVGPGAFNNDNGGPLAGLRRQPPGLSDAPLGFAGAPSPLDAPDAAGLGGPLTDTLPQLRLEDMPPRKPGFLGKGGAGWGILGAIGDGLSAYGGQRGTFLPALLDQQHEANEENRFERRLAAENEERRRKALDPRMEQVGNTIGWLDPSGAGSYHPIFTAPSPAEQFASARGYEPGTPDYQQAVEDYRLGSWSGPAMEARQSLEGTRFDNRETLQGERLSTSRRNTDVRASATRHGQILGDVRGRRGQDMNDARVRASAGFQGRGRHGSGGAGAKAMLNGRPIVVRNGAWVDEATGHPVGQ